MCFAQTVQSALRMTSHNFASFRRSPFGPADVPLCRRDPIGVILGSRGNSHVHASRTRGPVRNAHAISRERVWDPNDDGEDIVFLRIGLNP
ncbi:MAG: hypothetical protein DWH78_14805 [Planctomycetota bacterium]|nr:MAG: hypothetical protein DWH78_14805 [Planctomycetota bacterium]